MKKFTKKDLINKLGFTEEESKLIMDAQNEFPELLTDSSQKVSSVKKLYDTLGLEKAHWSRWTKKNIYENEFFLENIDWWGFTIEVNGNETVDFTVSLDFAKHLAMVVRNHNGHKIRNYFILMEKAVKRNIDWIEVREPQKQGYKDMCSAIKQNYEETHDGKECNKFLYSTNADMINLALFGYKSKQMKELLDLEYEEQLRENLRIEANKALANLQMLNESLNYDNIDFQTRRKVIESTCQRKYIGLRMRVVSEFNKEIANFPKES